MRACTELAGCAALLLVACAPTPPPVEFPVLLLPSTPCIPVVERLQHLDEPSKLGFSAVELLARVAGDSESPLIWLPPEPSEQYALAYAPEGGISSLRLRVTPAPGEVRYRHELVADGAPEGTECEPGVLEVPVTVSLQSGAQALDETFPARLEAADVYRARVSHEFAPGSWQGGFAITMLSSLDPEQTFAAGPLSLQVLLWEGGSQGSLSTQITAVYRAKARAAAREAGPEPLAAGAAQLALWPSAEACPAAGQSRLPSDARLLGFSVSDVLSALEHEGGKQLAWSSGETTALELSFIAPASELCQGFAGALNFEASVRVRTFDGQVDAELPVQISASNSGGALDEISVQSLESLDPSALPVQATLTQRGARSGALHVDLDASFRAGASAGTLTLSGTDAAAGNPAAAGAPMRELASGRWSQ